MSGIIQPLFFLLLIDVIFLAIVGGVVYLVTRGKPAGDAVLRRNFVGYFSNPTGYLFILLFVSLCSAGAFFPHDFFTDNLATLHQLNQWFPWIMLFFIPTITMGIWSEERRQGTDELLLTVPASDWDIVLGKYVAAAAIFTASLVFSQLANFLVLAFLSMGDVDLGLYATTYLGYWFVGLAMIAMGMVGSFLTRNLTIGFILGVLVNLPLVAGAYANALISSNVARILSRFSYGEQFFDFGRGVISMRSVLFFAMVIALGLYLSIVLVGRRHWLGGKDGQSLIGHYILRVIAILVLAVSLSAFLIDHSLVQFDGTSQKVNTLSDDTLAQIKALSQADGDDSRTVLIEAFISSQVPEEYVKTKIDLISNLREFEARGGGRIQVRIYDDLERSSGEAVRAEEQYGIQPETVMVRERGALTQKEVFMGVAFTSGLDRVIVPFFNVGIPLEYELVRSVSTVASPQRKRLGIVTTDAQLFGGFDMQRMSQIPKQLIVTELEKQYEVVQIDPSSPITEDVDAMMVVQPSSLAQPAMDNLVAAVKSGIPTAIFEDPVPYFRDAPGTGQPKPPRGGGMMGMGQPPEPKGDIQGLWDAIGVEMLGNPGMPGGMGMGMGGGGGGFDASVVWQDYLPYKKLGGFRQLTPEWVFASSQVPGGEDSLNPDDEIVSGMTEVLFIMPGAIKKQDGSNVTVTPIVTTGEDSGTIGFQELQTASRDGLTPDLVDMLRRRQKQGKLNIAVRIRSADADAGQDLSRIVPSTETLLVADEDSTPAGLPDLSISETEDAAPDKIDVVYVGDIDVLNSVFVSVRDQPHLSDIDWRFDNVAFVLNVVDDLAGDKRFLDVRKKRPRHSSLKLVEEKASAARNEAEVEMEKFKADFDQAEQEARQRQAEAVAELQNKVNEIQDQARKSGVAASGQELQRTLQAALQQVAMKQQVEQRRLDTTVESLTRDRDKQLLEIERRLEKQEQKLQSTCKWMALLLPMLPPLLIGLAVFARRRSLESEGITSARRK